MALRHADEQFAVQDADPAVRVGRPLAPRRGDRVDVLLCPQSARQELLEQPTAPTAATAIATAASAGVSLLPFKV